MRTEDAVTSADNLELAYAALIAVYVLLFGSVIWLLRRPQAREHAAEICARPRDLGVTAYAVFGSADFGAGSGT